MKYVQIDWTEPPPKARHSDPDTSKEAALDAKTRLRWSQRAVRELFERKGEMTDRDLVEAYQRSVRQSDVDWPYQSPSGLRTRRDELVTLGVLYDTGRSQVYQGSDRRHTIWALKTAP